jgi:nucleotide-binding universal stress UspA family protein
MAYTHVIVGSDGSETALVAVRKAAALAAGLDSPLRVICAYHPVAGRDQALVPSRVADVKGRMTGKAAAQQALDVSVEAATAAGASADGELRVGDAVDVLLEIAEAVEQPLLVVGSRGMRRLSGRLLGAVPSDLSHRARCDVLIAQTSTGQSTP